MSVTEGKTRQTRLERVGVVGDVLRRAGTTAER